MAYYNGELLKQNFGKSLNEFEGINIPLSEVAIKIGQVIRDTPPADVEEVRHGHWIPTPHSIGINKTPYECSRCGMAAEQKYPYCNCGAKMDGEQK